MFYAGVGVAFLYSFIIAVAPPLFFSKLLVGFEGVLVVLGAYYLFVLIRAIAHRRPGSVTLLVGYVAFFSSLVGDILGNLGLLEAPSLLSLGVFVFVVCLALVMSRRFARLYRQVERLIRIRSELRSANESLRELSYVDALTEVSNRRHFDEFFRHEWSRGIRNDTSIGMLMIDIDGFKAYNDNYGHSAGDHALKKVAAALQRSLQRSVDFLARYGGEEFVVILPSTDIDGASRVAEKLRAAVENLRIPHGYSDTGTFLTISIGVAALLPNPKSSRGDLLNEADRALYRAKQWGKNQVVVIR